MLELVLRLATVTEILVLVAVLSRSMRRTPIYAYLLTLLLGIGAYLLVPVALLNWQWGNFTLIVLVPALLVPVFFWFFAAALFNDDFKPGNLVFIVALVTAGLGLLAFCSGPGLAQACQLTNSPWPDRAAQAVKFGWVAAAAVMIVQGWRADLVAARRILRVVLTALAGLYILAVLLVEAFMVDGAPRLLELVNVILILLAVSILTLHMLRTDSNNILAVSTRPADTPSAHDSPLAQALQKAMVDRAYAAEGLTIERLATRLGTQPHRLRKVINEELGYRNFNRYINHYRVKEIAYRLSLEEFRDTAVLTLALDAGFRSLAPFNRSFKEQFGTTPSDYRQSLVE